MDIVLRKNDVERNGHIYCKVCGKRVDGELLDLGFTKFIPRIKCECEIKRDKENEERERLMKISSLKRDCFSSPNQHQYNFEKYLNEKGQAYKVAYNYAKSFEQMKEDNVGLLFYGDVGSGKTYEVVDYVEIDKACVKSYNALYEEDYKPKSVVGYKAPNEKIDLIMHGSPCQDFSRIGKKQGGAKNSGTRSSLLFETIRIIKEMKEKPKWIIWENVKGVLDRNMRDSLKKSMFYL